jgi:hypothetical protein
MLCLGDPRDDTGDRLIWLVLAVHVPARTSFLDAGVFPRALWEKVLDETGRVTACPAGYSPRYVAQ